MTIPRLQYTHGEPLMAEHAYASRLRWDGVLFHGGLDPGARNVRPASPHRVVQRCPGRCV